MTKGSLNRREKKYDLLTTYLQMNGGSQVTITFTQFDEMLFPHAGYLKPQELLRNGGQMIGNIQKKVLMVG